MDYIKKQLNDEEAEINRIAEENKKKAKEEEIPVRDEILWGELSRIVEGGGFRTMLDAVGTSIAKNFEPEETKKPVAKSAQTAQPIVAKREPNYAYDPSEAMRIYLEKTAKNKETQ